MLPSKTYLIPLGVLTVSCVLGYVSYAHVTSEQYKLDRFVERWSEERAQASYDIALAEGHITVANLRLQLADKMLGSVKYTQGK